MKTFVCYMLVCLALTSAASLRQLSITEIAPVQVDPNVPVQIDPNAPAQVDPNAPPTPPVRPLPQSHNLQVLQRIINGLADEAGVQLTTNIDVCIDESTARNYDRFISRVLAQLSNKNWIGLPDTVNRFRAGFAPAVFQCLGDNAGLKGIWDAYNLTGLGMVNLYVKFAAYAIGGNYDVLVHNLTDIKDVLKIGQYEIGGRLIGQLIRTVVSYDPNANQNQEAPPVELLSKMRNTFMYNQRYNQDYEEEDNENNGDEESYNENNNNRNYNNDNDEEDEDQEDDQDNEEDNNNNNQNDCRNENEDEDEDEGQEQEQDEDNNDNEGYNNNNYNNKNYNNNNNNNDNDYQQNYNNDNQNYGNQNNDYSSSYNNDNSQGQQQDDYSSDNNDSNDYGSGDYGYGGFEYGDPAPQLLYNFFVGLAELAKQSPPKSLRQCFNGQSGRISLDFLLDTVGEVNDRGFERLRPTVAGYLNTVPQTTLECVAKSKDFKNLLTAYNIKEKTLQAFYAKIAAFGLEDDYMKIVMAARQILVSSDQEDFTNSGQNAGKLLKVVFKGNGSSSNNNQQAQ